MNARAKLLGTRAKPGRLVEVEINGEKVAVELRSPSMGTKGQIAQAAGLKQNGDIPDLALLLANILLHCAYEPGGRRLFQASDLPELLAMGPEIDDLQKAALELFTGGQDPAGKSEPTPSSG